MTHYKGRSKPYTDRERQLHRLGFWHLAADTTDSGLTKPDTEIRRYRREETTPLLPNTTIVRSFREIHKDYLEGYYQSPTRVVQTEERLVCAICGTEAWVPVRTPNKANPDNVMLDPTSGWSSSSLEPLSRTLLYCREHARRAEQVDQTVTKAIAGMLASLHIPRGRKIR